MVLDQPGGRAFELFKIVEATDSMGLGFSSGKRRKQHGSKNSDNGDYHEQLNKGKPGIPKTELTSGAIAIYIHMHRQTTVSCHCGGLANGFRTRWSGN